jgi:hypothetical protein
VILGCLGLSWLILVGLITFILIDVLPAGISYEAIVYVLIWLLASGPHILFIYAVWRERCDGQIDVPAVAAPVYLVCSLYFLSLLLIGVPARKLGPCFFNFSLLVWVLGWPLGIQAAVLARRRPPLAPPDDE